MGHGLFKGRAPSQVDLMFNFSANNLVLTSRYDCKSCVVFIMQDRHTKRLYRLYDFSKSQNITPDRLWCVSGKVNSADKLYLVIDSVKIDSKNSSATYNSGSF
jgi:20S proteasome alpha/beta subunit